MSWQQKKPAGQNRPRLRIPDEAAHDSAAGTRTLLEKDFLYQGLREKGGKVAFYCLH